MPYGGAQVIIQPIDFDQGDDTYYGDYIQMVEFIQTRLLSMKVRDRDRGKDRLELVFRNDDFAMIESPVFARGQKLLVTWGWPGEMVPPRRFIVKSVKGGDRVTIVANCRLSLLDKERKSRFEEQVTHSEFVTKVADEYGYSGTYQWIEATSERTDVTQNRRTDARMVHKLARRNGFVFYEDATGFHWHTRNLKGEPVRWFVYRKDEGRGDLLGPPQFDINMSKGISRVRVTYRDPVTKEYGEVFGGPDDTELESLGEETEMGNPDDSDQGRRADRMTREDTRCGGVMTKEEAQREADARYYETANGRYKMSVPIIGDSRVGAKLLVGFAGISDMLDGLYYITEAEHVVEGGKWTIDLKCRKNAVNRLKVAKSARRGQKENKNPNATDTDEATAIEQAPTLKKTVTLTTDSAGNVIPAYAFQGSGEVSGALDTLTPDEVLALNDRTLEQLYNLGGQSAEPDSGM